MGLLLTGGAVFQNGSFVNTDIAMEGGRKIGRASCRERVFRAV